MVVIEYALVAYLYKSCGWPGGCLSDYRVLSYHTSEKKCEEEESRQTNRVMVEYECMPVFREKPKQ